MTAMILSKNNLVDNLYSKSLSEPVEALDPEVEAENRDFDPDQEDEPAINDDTDDYYDRQVEISLALEEQQFIAKEQATKQAIAFAQDLLKPDAQASKALVRACFHYELFDPINVSFNLKDI